MDDHAMAPSSPPAASAAARPSLLLVLVLVLVLQSVAPVVGWRCLPPTAVTWTTCGVLDACVYVVWIDDVK